MTGWRIAVGAVLIIHGAGHALGVIPAFADISENWNTESWLLSDSMGANAARTLAVSLWIICLVGFIASGLALLGVGLPVEWWKPLAVAFGILSLATLFLFWDGFPALVPNKVGAIAVDLAAVFGTLIWSWPSDDMLGL